MDKTSFNDYLDKRYYEQLKYYESTAGKNQRKYKKFQWTLIILSALTPVIAALPQQVEILSSTIHLKYIVVIISALVAILTTGLKTFQYQELWVNYRSTIEQLKPEIYYLNFNAGPYSEKDIDKEATFVNRVESILNKEHDGWPASKKVKDEKSKSDGNNSEK